VVVHCWLEEMSRDMVMDKREDYNKGVYHMLVDIEVFHRSVVFGDVNCGV
jgi:hypothetical protein